MQHNPVDLSLYLIADDAFCEPKHMLSILQQVIQHGISCVQLRMKLADKKVVTKTAASLLPFLHSHNIPLIINDYPDIVKKVNADGVHLGQGDSDCQAARELLGREKIIGLSIENRQQAEKCRHYDVDYFGVGPVFVTASKPNAAPPIGIAGLHEIIQLLTKPIVAIGGINKNNVKSLLKTGVAGIAVISAILKAPCPAEAAAELATVILE